MRPTLKDWGFDGRSLTGKVYDHPGRFEDGKFIRTSSLQEVFYEGDTLVGRCKSREYVLDGIDPEYEVQFPNAINRFLRRSEDDKN